MLRGQLAALDEIVRGLSEPWIGKTQREEHPNDHRSEGHAGAPLSRLQ
jgi:hypothetical protein